MTRRDFTNAGTILCAMGATLLTIREPLSKSYPTLGLTWHTLLIAGIFLSALGVLSLLARVVIGIGEPIKEGLTNVIFRGVESPHLRTFAGLADLQTLHDVYAKYFGDEVAAVSVMKSWLTRCKTAFVLIYREIQNPNMSKKHELVGSFKVLPLTAAGVESLQLGKVSGATFKPEHICARAGRSSSFYVGDLFATDRTAKAVVLHELKSACAQVADREVTFYARPLTREGRHVMKRRGFVLMSDEMSEPEIGKLCVLRMKSTGLEAGSPYPQQG